MQHPGTWSFIRHTILIPSKSWQKQLAFFRMSFCFGILNQCKPSKPRYCLIKKIHQSQNCKWFFCPERHESFTGGLESFSLPCSYVGAWECWCWLFVKIEARSTCDWLRLQPGLKLNFLKCRTSKCSCPIAVQAILVDMLSGFDVKSCFSLEEESCPSPWLYLDPWEEKVSRGSWASLGCFCQL